MNRTSQQHNQPEPARQLQPDVHNPAVEILRSMLPPPIHDTPKTRARRERIALAEVAFLAPATAAEARLAARHVAAREHSDDCLRLAAQLRAEAVNMGREARGYYNALLRMQVTRAEHGPKTQPVSAARRPAVAPGMPTSVPGSS